MEWKYVDKELPICYETGDWDGKRSDEVLVQDRHGNNYLAVLYSGIIDGNDFSEWQNQNGMDIYHIVRWCNIPE